MNSFAVRHSKKNRQSHPIVLWLSEALGKVMALLEVMLLRILFQTCFSLAL